MAPFIRGFFTTKDTKDTKKGEPTGSPTVPVCLHGWRESRNLLGVMNDHIVIDPKICHGKPVIRNTRTPVALVVGSLAGGMSFEAVQREYDLTVEDIRAALKFAGELVEQEQHHLLPA